MSIVSNVIETNSDALFDGFTNYNNILTVNFSFKSISFNLFSLKVLSSGYSRCVMVKKHATP